jgi:acetylornithine deacetylase/succinyl-diaminopimelate desuccinylase-like protein
VVPTVIDAGFRRNVIPSEASAILDIRMLPDEDVEDFYAQLAAVIGDPRVEIVPEKIYRPAAPPSEIDNEMFQTLEQVAVAMYPEATVLPIMQTGATDMAQMRDRRGPSRRSTAATAHMATMSAWKRPRLSAWSSTCGE